MGATFTYAICGVRKRQSKLAVYEGRFDWHHLGWFWQGAFRPDTLVAIKFQKPTLRNETAERRQQFL